MVSLVNSLIGIVVGLITVVSTYYIFLKYVYAPRITVTFLEPDAIFKGTLSDIDEFHFKGNAIPRNRRLRILAKLSEKKPIVINETKTDQLRIPIIIQNLGHREAERYKLSVTFSTSKVRILDVETETLSFDGIYIQDEKNVSEHLTRINASSKIRDIYSRMNLEGDYFSVTGSLATRAFEMILVELDASQVRTFEVNLRIDSPSLFSKRIAFYKPYLLSPSKK